MTNKERKELAAWIDDAYRRDFQLRMPPEIGALVSLALEDIQRLERSKRILEGDYNKLHDELISAESTIKIVVKDAAKTRDRVLARCERLETAISNAIALFEQPERLENPIYHATANLTFVLVLMEALAATDKEPEE